LVDKPVTDMESGGTWGLNKGQVTLFWPLFTLKENKSNLRKTFSIK
jgi:hypothetical protein